MRSLTMTIRVSIIVIFLVIFGIQAPSYGITLVGVDSLTQTETVGSGDVIYTLRVSNTGAAADTITLTTSGDVASATLSPSPVELAAGASQDVTLTVPGAALSSAGTYQVYVTATSQADTTQTATVTTTTTITGSFGVSLVERDSTVVGPPIGVHGPVTITYLLQVSNTGTASDTINLTTSGNVEGATISPSRVTLAAGASQIVYLRVSSTGVPSDGKFHVYLTATSQGDITKTATVVVTNSDQEENNPPIFNEGRTTARSVREDVPIGTNIGAPLAATDLDSDTLTYLLNPDDSTSQLFEIDSATGQLKTKAALDYETATTYTLNALVTDGDSGGSDTITVTVQIIDIDDTSGVTLNYGVTLIVLGSLTQTATVGSGDVNYTLRVSNAGTVSDTITFTTSGDVASATVSPSSVALAVGASQDVTLTVPGAALSSNGTYQVSVTATPQGDTTKTATVTTTTTISDTFGVRLEIIGIAGGGGKDTYILQVSNIGTVSDTITLTMSGDVESATLSLSRVTLAAGASRNVILKVPNADTYRVSVTATSQGDTTQTDTVAVTNAVQEENNPPTFDKDNTTIHRVREDVPIGTNIGAPLTATDLDDDTLTYKLYSFASTSQLFEIDSATGQLKTIAALDYETATTHTMTVFVTDDHPEGVDFITVTVYIINPDPSDPSDPSDQSEPTLSDPTSHTVIFSEFMFESKGGENGLPQWIEVYNNSTSNINLRGWKLHWKHLLPIPFEVTTTFKEDFIIPVEQSRLIVTSLGRHSGGGKLSDDDVYQLHVLHVEELGQEDVENLNRMITRGGFSLKLTNSKDVLIDHIGTLQGDKQTWQLHECLIEGVRSSLIRRFDNGVPRSGTERGGWRRAFDAKRLVAGLYYGSQHDLGTPGYRRGKPLPVQLSQFSAQFVDGQAIISWTTESELDNAGFNILRSQSEQGPFVKVNPTLIQGAGTTGERNEYTWTDTTAKPNTFYYYRGYYRIEDVSHAGVRKQLATVRLRGFVSAKGKLTTSWGVMKTQN